MFHLSHLLCKLQQPPTKKIGKEKGPSSCLGLNSYCGNLESTHILGVSNLTWAWLRVVVNCSIDMKFYLVASRHVGNACDFSVRFKKLWNPVTFSSSLIIRWLKCSALRQLRHETSNLCHTLALNSQSSSWPVHIDDNLYLYVKGTQFNKSMGQTLSTSMLLF